jgi:hypothetical protein
MARHPHTKQIRALGLAWAGLDDDKLAALLPAGAWPRLTDLRLERNAFTARGARHLGRSAPAGLESLCLAESLRGGEASAVLARCEFPALTRLELSGCTFTDEAVSALAKAPFAGQLRVLGLSTVHGLYGGRFDARREGRFGDDGLLALICSDRLRQLRRLDVSGQAITERGARSLLGSGIFPQMESLDLRGIAIAKELQGELSKRYGKGVCRFSHP